MSVTPAPVPKDLASSSIVLGIVSVIWFSLPPVDGALRWAFVAASVLAIALVVAAVVRLRTTAGPASMSVSPRARRVWWAALAFEVVAIPAALLILRSLDQTELTPAVVLGIVALHFIPLAQEFRMADLWWVTAACLAVTALGIAAHFGGWAHPGVIAGGLGGTVLLLGGIVMFLRSQRASRTR